MERALFTSSFQPFLLLRPRISSRTTPDTSSKAGFPIENYERHSPQHLQMACLALQYSESVGWPRPNDCNSKEMRQLLGYLQTLNSIGAPLLSYNSERKDFACRCSSEQRSSLSGAAAPSPLSRNINIAGGKETNGAIDDSGEFGDSMERPPSVGRSTLSDQRFNDGGARVKSSIFGLATPIEGPAISAKEPIYEWNESVEQYTLSMYEKIYKSTCLHVSCKFLRKKSCSLPLCGQANVLSNQRGIACKKILVVEVTVGGTVVTKSVSRRLLLKTSGLRLRDIRSVDPSLWVTNAAPALRIRDQAILLNLGSLRAIASADNVLVFDHKSIGAEAFLQLLLQRLNPDSNSGVPTMPFELEVMEAALLSRTQRLERKLMEIEPRVVSLLEVLPNCFTANILEELRLCKQALVELGSKAGALRQMLLELLESPQEIRRMTIMGRHCTIRKEDGTVECIASVDKQLADDEEEEMEMLLENYLQRCESCHGQAERLLDSARETEDSIAVNLSSRRLEVSRLELLLQVGTFCAALGALVAGMFGMNLRSYLEESAVAFWLTTAGIVLGGIVLFFVMYNYLRQKKIL